MSYPALPCRALSCIAFLHATRRAAPRHLPAYLSRAPRYTHTHTHTHTVSQSHRSVHGQPPRGCHPLLPSLDSSSCPRLTTFSYLAVQHPTYSLHTPAKPALADASTAAGLELTGPILAQRDTRIQTETDNQEHRDRAAAPCIAFLFPPCPAAGALDPATAHLPLSITPDPQLPTCVCILACACSRLRLRASAYLPASSTTRLFSLSSSPSRPRVPETASAVDSPPRPRT